MAGEPTETSNHALVRRFYAVLWNAWDDEAVESVLADDFAFRGSLGQETTGRDGWRAYRDMVHQASPDFRTDIVELIGDGGRAAARVVCSGRHEGTLLGMPGSGRHFEYAVAAFFTIRRGLISEAWVLGDLETLRGQLGAPASG